MKEWVPSSPNLLKLVAIALVAALAIVLVAAVFVPAPLEIAADPSRSPNPAKSAWFLLWIQELVSHGTLWIYPVLALMAATLALPWLRRSEGVRAAWFQRGERLVATVVLIVVFAIIVLTFIAVFMRGENWQLYAPSW